jgi:hypothetical protein
MGGSSVLPRQIRSSKDLRFTNHRRYVPYRSIQFDNAELMKPLLLFSSV